MLDEVLAKTSQQLTPLFISQYRSGKTIDFGAMQLKMGSLVFRKHNHVFEDISSISQNNRGEVFVRGKNGHVLIGNVASHKIKNLHVLSDIIKELN